MWRHRSIADSRSGQLFSTASDRSSGWTFTACWNSFVCGRPHTHLPAGDLNGDVRGKPQTAGPARFRYRARDIGRDGADGVAATMEQTPGAAAPADAGAAAAAAAAKQAQDKPYEEVEYRRFPVVGSRVAIWMVAQLHLLFAAFVLAVPMFAFIVEAIGYKTGDPRYDRLAHEFTKLLSVSFSLTATFGAVLTFMLIILYPKFTNYLMSVFSPTFLPVRPAVLRRSLLSLHLLLRLGEVPSAGSSRPGTRPQPRRHGRSC